MKARIIICLIFFKVLSFASLVFSKTIDPSTQLFPPETIVFKNFDNEITLIKQNHYYQIVGSDQKFNLSNRLIVKTAKNLSQKELYQSHSLVTGVSQLFTGTLHNYYSLELKNDKVLFDVLKILQNKKGIVLVQPDLLQLKPKTIIPKKQIDNSPETSKERANKRLLGKARREERIKEKKALKSIAPSPYITMLNLDELWKKTTGNGVKVAIIDDGFNLEHPDLKHLSPFFSYDFDSGKLGAAPHYLRDGHGTKVAGIIFAAHDHKGIDGIAPDAEIIILRQPDTWTSNTMLSFQLANLAGATIINCSWHSQFLLQPVAEIIDDLSLHGRNGKGVVVVFAAGNEGKEILPESTEASIKSAIVVGAQSAKYERLAGSNYGESVDVLVYGGRVQTTLASGEYGNFSGTSLAAAIVSGWSALLISKHPEMTVKELSNQLKLQAKKESEGE